MAGAPEKKAGGIAVRPPGLKDRRRDLYCRDHQRKFMCRNIKTLHNFAPPATETEVRASSLQFVRKLSGFTKPSKANEEAFDRAVEGVTRVAQELLQSLTTQAPPRDREVEAAKAKARSAQRFGSQPHTHADGHTHTHEHEHEHPHSHVH
jgi:hypothetical protein